MCQSAGSGFTFGQNKAARCPGSTRMNVSDWSCDDWKCHMYCSNPINKVARKACGNCEEPTVSSGFASKIKRERASHRLVPVATLIAVRRLSSGAPPC
mmetsp:Transcript_116456/g.370443  ORF Transcript_116456/g.370443 Transcript_116456/m.370443 type:complete len:98 (-) Transcript_116456:152-445(-)